MDSAAAALEKRLYRQLRRTVEEFDLLAAGDRVLVAMSGGKDSYTLAHLLRQLVRARGGDVELVAVHLDQRQPGYDGRPLREWLAQSGLRYEILSEDTYSAVVSTLEEGATYCSLCSRLRRGILYTAAERLGCNKIALGHHRDDAIETFLMNALFSGKLQAMPAKYTTDDGRFEVIRPLVECEEATIARVAEALAFPILPCNLCGSQSGLERESMRELLDGLERRHPHVRSVLLHALKNVRPTHLLDAEVAAAWEARSPKRSPAPVAEGRAPRHRALPIWSSDPTERQGAGKE